MEISVQREDKKYQFTGSNGTARVSICASPQMEEGNVGFRPTELVLTALGGCMSIDVLNILYKQRQFPEDFRIVVDGVRSEELPGLFDEVVIHVVAMGELKLEKFKAAIALSAEKYCTVYKILECTANMRCKYQLNHEAGEI